MRTNACYFSAAKRGPQGHEFSGFHMGCNYSFYLSDLVATLQEGNSEFDTTPTRNESCLPSQARSFAREFDISNFSLTAWREAKGATVGSRVLGGMF